MSHSLSIVLLGTGTPAPLPHRVGTSTLVMLGSQGIVFDLGPGATFNLVAAGIEPAAVTHVFFTHHHFDHNTDFGHFVLTRWDQGAGRGDELEVYGPPPTARLTDLLFGETGVYGPDLEARSRHPMSLRAYRMRGGVLPRRKPVVRPHELGLGDQVQGDGWTVRTGRAVHAQPYLESLAYRFEAPVGSIVISGDTCPLPEMVELARGAHTLIHMGMELDEARERWPDVYGSCTSALGAGKIAAEAGVQRLVLVHLGPAADDPGQAEAMAAEARSVFSGEVVAGEDRTELAVTSA